MYATLVQKNQVKPIAIYVHGLGSRAASTVFSEYEWKAIEVNENPFESIEKINAIVSEFKPSLLIGTSLGGYYVFFADASCAKKVICNPAMNILELIRLKIGFGTFFAAHDELIGDANMLDNMALVFDTGYRLLLDSKGGHRPGSIPKIVTRKNNSRINIAIRHYIE